MFQAGAYPLAQRLANLAYKVLLLLVPPPAGVRTPPFSSPPRYAAQLAQRAHQSSHQAHVHPLGLAAGGRPCLRDRQPLEHAGHAARPQGVVFAIVGFAAGTVGTATSNLLLAARKRLDPGFESQNAAPDVLRNAGTWAVHMGVSSNVRYQILNGLDMVRARSPPVGAGACFLTTPLRLAALTPFGGSDCMRVLC